MQLTDRINRIQISPTAAVISAADQLKAQGVDIADFGPGEPDFPTPDHIKKAAIKAIEENRTKYTPTGGIMPLREAIVRVAQARTRLATTRRRNAWSPSAESIRIFNTICVLMQTWRRSDSARAVLGQFSGHHQVRRRHAGDCARRAPEDGFSAKAADDRKSHHAKNENGDYQFAEQSDRRRG